MGYWATAVVVRPPQTPTPRGARDGRSASDGLSAGPVGPYGEASRERPGARHRHERRAAVQPHLLGARPRPHRARPARQGLAAGHRDRARPGGPAGNATAPCAREEEPGRIHNEQRNLFGWRAPLWLKLLFGLGLSSIWGGTPTGYTTYFASDSTPLFIILVAALADREPGILDATVTAATGACATLADSVAGRAPGSRDT